MRGHFLKSQIEKKSQKVAPLFKIVALFKENFGATFWRFLTQKVAPSDLKHLVTLAFIYLQDVSTTVGGTISFVYIFFKKNSGAY